MERNIILSIISFCIVSVIFAGCGNNYDDDISNLYGKNREQDSVLNDLRNAVLALQDNIANLRTISNVETTATGYRIHFSAGQPAYIDIRNGTDGTSGSIWTIGSGVITGTHTDSVWYLNGQPTEWIALPPPGRNGQDGEPIPVRSPGIDEEGYWVTYEWNESKNAFDSIQTAYKADHLTAYVTDNPANLNQWILHVRYGAQGTAYQEVILPKNDAGLPGASGYAGSMSLFGYTHITSAGALLSQAALPDTSLVIEYWYIDSIYNVTTSTRLSEWQGKKHVLPKQLLSTLNGKKISLALSSDVTPGVTTYVLKNSRNESLPLNIATPVPFTGLLTKAEIAGGQVYLATLSVYDSTYLDATAVTNNFRSRFKTGAVYYVETGNGVKSSYSPFSIDAADRSAVAVTQVNVALVGTVPPSAGTYNLRTGEVYDIRFDAVNGAYVWDYTIDASGSPDVAIYAASGSFSVSQAGSYNLTVQKLHVDGKIYEETIQIAVVD
ncbi:MAG: hypothetical protein LBT76_05100 [Tannerella sp.]|nr:hypothetical protein [Tannerella sp.]